MENRNIAGNRVPLWLKLAYTAFMAQGGVLRPLRGNFFDLQLLG